MEMSFGVDKCLPQRIRYQWYGIYVFPTGILNNCAVNIFTVSTFGVSSMELMKTTVMEGKKISICGE